MKWRRRVREEGEYEEEGREHVCVCVFVEDKRKTDVCMCLGDVWLRSLLYNALQ